MDQLRRIYWFQDENNVSSPNVLSQSLRNENDVSSEPYIDHPLPDVIRFASVNGEVSRPFLIHSSVSGIPTSISIMHQIAEAQAMACDVENNPVIESSSLNVSQTSDDDGQACIICNQLLEDY